MQRRSNTQASSLVIFLSLLTIISEFLICRFINMDSVVWALTGLISIICCHILLQQTSTYRVCFDYSFLCLFISLIIILLTYQGNDSSFLPYSSTMLGIAFINWVVPRVHCFLRYTIDYGTKVDEFNLFYRFSSILFVIFYLIIIFYGNLAKNAFPWAYGSGLGSYNFVPFRIISSLIEDYIYGSLHINQILIYLASRILVFLPYGYYISLMLRRKKRIVRYSCLLILPILIEIVQYFVIPSRCDIDDLIYALIGGVLGFFAFFLTNVIYKAFSGYDFLAKDHHYHIYTNHLRF